MSDAHLGAEDRGEEATKPLSPAAMLWFNKITPAHGIVFLT